MASDITVDIKSDVPIWPFLAPYNPAYSCKLKLIDHQPHRLLREEARVRAAFGAGPEALPLGL